VVFLVRAQDTAAMWEEKRLMFLTLFNSSELQILQAL
jgi:hypothetical protein